MRNLLPGHYVKVEQRLTKALNKPYMLVALYTKDVDNEEVRLGGRVVDMEPRKHDEYQGQHYFGGPIKLADDVTEQDIQQSVDYLTKQWLERQLASRAPRGKDLVGTYPPKRLGIQ